MADSTDSTDIFGALAQDPKFLMGLTLLGGANSRNAPLQQAATMLMNMQTSKRKSAMEQAQLEQEKVRTALYQQQIMQGQRSQDNQDKYQGMAMEYLKKSGIDLGNLGGQPQGAPPNLPAIGGPAQQADPQAPQQAPAQGQPDLGSMIFKSKIIPQESGGNHFNPKTGAPLTSPAGAVGISQVMPGTAPEAAQLAGVPWNPELFNRKFTGNPTIDAETSQYNASLGEAYFKKQLQTFGTPDKAAAAYNAGPGAVQKAMTLAGQIGKPEMWTSFLPNETKNYIKQTGLDQAGQQQPTPSAIPAPPTSPLGMRNPALPLQIASALMKGPAGIGELGTALAPKSLTPGGLQQDYQGNITQLPDPMGEAKLKIEQSRLANDTARLGNETLKTQKEIQAGQRTQDKADAVDVKTQSSDTQAYKNITSNLDRLKATAQQLLDHPGLNYVTGAGKIFSHIPGTPAADAAAMKTTLETKVAFGALAEMRASSKTGGALGAISDPEEEMLKNSLEPLGTNQSPKQLRQSLQGIIKFVDESKGRYKEAFDTNYPDAAKAKLQTLPQGSVQIGKSGGKAVFKTPSGDTFIQD